MSDDGLKTTVRRCGSSSEVEVPERLPGGVLHDEARIIVLLDGPRWRETARGGHGAASSTVAVWRTWSATREINGPFGIEVCPEGEGQQQP